MKLELLKNIPDGQWQGGVICKGIAGPDFMICAISDRLYRISIEPPYTIVEQASMTQEGIRSMKVVRRFFRNWMK